jgi:pre-rRNA-processing protein TSR1
MQNKQDKRNQQRMIQKQKRMDLIQQTRLFHGLNGAPKETVIVPLCSDVDATSAIFSVFQAMDEEPVFHNGGYTLSTEKFKQRIRFIPTGRDLLQVLDATKIADRIIFLVSSEVEVDSFGERLMSCIKIQGVPDVSCMVHHLENHSTKKQSDIRKSLLLYMSHHFPGELKLFSLGNTTDCVNCVRQITSQTPKGIVWRDKHPYVVAEEWTVEESENGNCTVKVTGFVRGNNLSSNRLVHIPNFGDYQVSKIVAAPIRRDHDMVIDEEILHEPSPELQDTLLDQNIPDPMEGEQTWPTEEELAEAEQRVQNKEHEREETPFGAPRRKRVPKGTSAYQAAWILEDDEEGEEVSTDDDMQLDPLEASDEEPEEYEEIEMENRSIYFDELDEEENEKQ